MEKSSLRPLSFIVFAILGVLIVVFFLRYNRNYEYASEYFERDETQVAPLAQSKVDFEKLKAANTDAVGWIYFENCDISYPIMQGEDNSEYVHKNAYKTGSKNGSIYLDADNAGDFSDAYNIIYGNNMHDDTMFGKLDNYFNEEGFLESNLMVQILTTEGNYRFQVFAIGKYEDGSEIFNVKKKVDSDYRSMVSLLKENSQKKINTDNYADFDKVTSLVTHSPDGGYYVVSLVKIDYME